MQRHEQWQHGVVVEMKVVAAMEIVSCEEVSTSEDLIADNIVHVLSLAGLEVPDVSDFLTLVQLLGVPVDSEDSVSSAENHVLDLAVVGGPVSGIAGDLGLARWLGSAVGLASADRGGRNGEDKGEEHGDGGQEGRHVGVRGD